MGILLATKNDRDPTIKNQCSMDFKIKIQKSFKIPINLRIKFPPKHEEDRSVMERG